MKIAYLKILDPISWRKPDVQWFDSDMKFMKPNILRTAGLIVFEDEENLVVGEASTAEDNPELNEVLTFPRYRYVMVIAKSAILEREDFEVGK